MIVFCFLLIALLSNAITKNGTQKSNPRSELYHTGEEISDELLWIRTQARTVDLRGKELLDSAEEVKVYAVVDKKADEERVIELEQKLHQVMTQVHHLQTPRKRNWFGCKKRKRRVPPPLPPTASPLPRSKPTIVHVHTRPPRISNNVTNTNSITLPPITNTITCPPIDTTINTSSSSHSSPQSECLIQNAKLSAPPIAILPDPPSDPPSKPESQTTDEKSDTPSSDAESCPPLPESAPSDTPPPDEKDKEPVPMIDSHEKKVDSPPIPTVISTSEEKLPEIPADPEKYDEESPPEEERPSKSKRPSVTLVADIKFREKKEPELGPYPIYTSAKYSGSGQKTRKRASGVGLRISMSDNEEEPLPIMPIYSRHSTKSVQTKKSTPKKDGSVRKVRFADDEEFDEPEETTEPNDIVRKVYFAEENNPSSSESDSPPVTGSKNSESKKLSRKRAARVALTAKYWPQIKEEDIYSKYHYTRPGHPQLMPEDYNSRYITRQTHGKRLKLKRDVHRKLSSNSKKTLKKSAQKSTAKRVKKKGKN